MRDMVDFMFVQADGADEVDLDFVARRDAADEVPAGALHGLRDRQDGRDVVAGMGIIGGEEGVVIVELAHRRAVGPGGPFRADRGAGGRAEDRGAALAGMAERHAARGDDRAAVDGGDGDGGIVDDAVDDHRGHVLRHGDLVGGDAGDFPGELVLALERGFGRIDANFVKLHGRLVPFGFVRSSRQNFDPSREKEAVLF